MELALEHAGGQLTLTVSDHGRGLSSDYVAGTGMRGMQERATLVGAQLTIEPEPGASGCRVRLALALGDRG